MAATEVPLVIITENSLLPMIDLGGTRLDTVKIATTFLLPDCFVSDPESTTPEYLGNEISKSCNWKLEEIMKQNVVETTYLNGEYLGTVFARTVVMDNRTEYAQRILGETDSRELPNRWAEFKEVYKENLNYYQSHYFWSVEERRNMFNARAYKECLDMTAGDRKFFISKKGAVGLVPPCTQPGDVVVVFSGVATPTILRKWKVATSLPGKVREIAESKDYHVSQNVEAWKIVGGCYVHGFMDNEILRPEYAERKQMFFIC